MSRSLNKKAGAIFKKTSVFEKDIDELIAKKDHCSLTRFDIRKKTLKKRLEIFRGNESKRFYLSTAEIMLNQSSNNILIF